MSNERANLLYGPPASGKSTIAKNITEVLPLRYLSIGDITRKEIADDTPNGIMFKKYLDEISQYPVKLITNTVEVRIASILKNNDSFLLDGFPKYFEEAETFVDLMQKYKFKINMIIIINLSLENSLKRACDRRICDSCLTQTTLIKGSKEYCNECDGKLIIREDDQPDTLSRRYKDYEESIDKTLTVLDGYYNRIIHINGSKKQKTIVRDIMKMCKPE